MFNGLRTQEGMRLAQNFIAQFELQELQTDSDEWWCELFGEVQDRSYAERFEAASYSMSQQRLLAEIMEPFGGSDITPRKALFIADLMQLGEITPGVNQKILELMPEAFKSAEMAQEDFGTVSQARCFDPFYVYHTPAETGIWEVVIDGSNPTESLARLQKIDEGHSKSIGITNTDLAERFLENPLALVEALVEITRFVRDSNEATYATFIEFYCPALLAIEREKEAKRLTDYILANAALGRSSS